MKLHLGCGGMYLPGYINIDLHADDGQADTSRHGCKADVIADMRSLPEAYTSIDEILTVHTFEHFTRWDAVDMLAHWFDRLADGGRVVIETPNLDECVRNYTLYRSQLYGNQWDRLEYETHRYVWTPTELCNVMESIGYEVGWTPNTRHGHYPGRDMRVIGVKRLTGDSRKG